MSATQIVLAALVLVAFALGWLARGRQERSRSSDGVVSELDAALGDALTAFQAVLGLWQREGEAISPLGLQALATFERRRKEAVLLSEGAAVSLETERAQSRARTALDTMATTVAAYPEGVPLSGEDEHVLFRAERSLTAARHSLLVVSHGPIDRTR